MSEMEVEHAQQPLCHVCRNRTARVVRFPPMHLLPINPPAAPGRLAVCRSCLERAVALLGGGPETGCHYLHRFSFDTLSYRVLCGQNDQVGDECTRVQSWVTCPKCRELLRTTSKEELGAP